jgi:hypothetical protein
MAKHPKRGDDVGPATSSSTTGKRMGRPTLSPRGSQQISVRFPAEIVDGLDEIVEERHGQAEYAAIIRELVAEALKNRKKRQ